MMTALIGLVGALLGALAGAVATYLTTRSRLHLELEYSYDRTLQNKRLELYQQLFHVSRCLPREWLSTEAPTRDDLRRFRERFHDWYFGKEAGGMFLTQAAKDVYMPLMNMLEKTADRPEGGSGTTMDSAPSATEAQALRDLASALRHQLAEDVGAANPPRLRWAHPGPTLRPPPRPRAG
jgi:hypothetical protein